MTVSSTTNRISFAGNGATLAFDTSPVVYFAETDLGIYLINDATGVATLKTLTTDYTTSGGAGSTGTVTMVVAPATGETLLIKRVVPYTQPDDYVNNDINDAEVHEDAHDRMVMMIQQIAPGDPNGTFNLHLGDVETPSAALTEIPFNRANKILSFGASKELQAVAGADSSAESVTATGTTASRLLANRFAGMLSALDNGCAGDGATADGANLNSLLVLAGTLAASASAIVLVNGEGKQYLVDQTIVIPAQVVLQNCNLVAGDSLNADIVTSENFATLTGTGEMNVATVPFLCGLRDVVIDGNLANNTSGRGVAFYSNQPIFDNVMIYQTAGDGFYSEGGIETISTWQEMVNGYAGQIKTRECAGNGIVIRGPHDMEWASLTSDRAGKIGILVESNAATPTTFNGSGVIGVAHPYRCGTALEVASAHSMVIVSGAADNGAGLIRLTVARDVFATGDWVSVQAIAGTVEANDELWKVTRIDATHIDLVGSTFANAYSSGGLVDYPAMALTAGASMDGGNWYVEGPLMIDSKNTQIATLTVGAIQGGSGGGRLGIQCWLSNAAIQIGTLRTPTLIAGQHGIKDTGNSNHIGNAYLFFTSGDGVGLEWTGARSSFKGEIQGLSAAGGIAFKWNPTATKQLGRLELVVITCSQTSEWANQTTYGGSAKILSYENTAADVVVVSGSGVFPPTLTNNIDIKAINTAGTLQTFNYSSETRALFNNTTAVGNVGTGADNLQNDPIITGALSKAGKGVRVRQRGVTANNGNAKTLECRLNTNTLVSQALVVSIAGEWEIEYDVVSTGTDTQSYWGTLRYESAAGVWLPIVFKGTLTEDDGASISCYCRGQGTSDDDIQQTHNLALAY